MFSCPVYPSIELVFDVPLYSYICHWAGAYVYFYA